MRYRNIEIAHFLDRPNRFIAHVELEGQVETVHVKNTGRCRELLIPGVTVYLERSTNPLRKTACDLGAVEKGERLINMDSQAPNKVFGEFALSGGFAEGVTSLWPEYTYGDSRLDFALQTPEGFHLVEVKGVTLEHEGVAYFPDAPTERGVKHLKELTKAAAAGIDASVVFVVQMEQVRHMSPNDLTHPEFGQALREAKAAGVNVRAFSCKVEPDELRIDREIPVVL